MYYKAVGHGTPLIVLHGGLGYDHGYLYHWLKPYSRDYRVIFLDLPGNGRSTRRMGQYSLEDLIDIVEAFRKSVIKQPAIVLGHSYGAYLALIYSLRFPKSILKMILVSTPIMKICGIPARRECFVQNLPEKEQAFVRKDVQTNKDFKRYIGIMMPIYFRSQHKAMLFSRHSTTQLAVRTLNHGYHLRMKTVDRYARRIYRIKIPTLITQGAHDVIVAKKNFDYLKKHILGAQSVLFRSSGHFPFVEEPALFRKTVKRFIGK
jgi:proline iminopeptidase